MPLEVEVADDFDELRCASGFLEDAENGGFNGGVRVEVRAFQSAEGFDLDSGLVVDSGRRSGLSEGERCKGNRKNETTDEHEWIRMSDQVSGGLCTRRTFAVR